MYSKLKLLCICFLLCITFSVASTENIKKESVQELQVLIDVSGSMKQNDPDNLRIPAVKLLVNLLPNGTKAGIWLFAEKTHKLVETGTVNEQWKKKALAKLKNIHSAGLFTNIEDAIQTSAQVWFKVSAKQNRNLILLTDGMVDVSKDIMQSAESRDRIMVEQVPKLQQADVKVQTIALSDNADAELLDKLAFDTNGWSETALSANQLQKVFFKMFKKAMPQNTVPMKGNVFKVDASIKEFSVLIFKKTGAPKTQLIAPDKTKIISAKTTENVAWLDEKNYDLITIKDPEAGVWKIVADMDPDNQVMIVTDLKFQLDEIPNHISEKESFDLSAYFTEQHQLISREDFLSLIEISIQQMDEKGGGGKWSMSPVSGKAGLFSHTIGATLGKGKHTIRILADGKTFQREVEKTIEVVESLVMIKTDVNEVKRVITIELIPDKTLINTEMMTVQAVISQERVPAKNLVIEKNQGKWVLKVAAPEQGDSKIINFSIMAKTVQGSSISPDIKPVIIDDSLFSITEVEPLIEKLTKEVKVDEIDVVDDEIKDEQEELVVDTVEVAEENDDINWIKTLAIVMVVNIVFMIAGFFLFKFMKKKSIEKQTELLNRLE